jgi:hypothetical protein
LPGSLLQIDVSKIVAHEADDPNAVVDFLDPDPLTGEQDCISACPRSLEVDGGLISRLKSRQVMGSLLL